MMNRADQVARILEARLIGIIRVRDGAQLRPAIEAMVEGGLRVLEVVMTVPGALELIREIRPFADAQGVLFGAGTVLDAETARLALLAGAEFLVSPVLRLEMIQVCARYGAVSIPGCATPTEMLTGWEHGADFVKVFPAVPLGGPEYIRMVRGALPQLRLITTGGVGPENAGEFLEAGCVAVGSGYMVSDALLEARDFDEIRRRSRRLVDAVAVHARTP